jgi:hypothetical protein
VTVVKEINGKIASYADANDWKKKENFTVMVRNMFSYKINTTNGK